MTSGIAYSRALKVRLGPAGVHVFDRRSGLNLLLDELGPPRSMWSLAPRQISVALTNACDLACPYCYAPKSPGRLAADTLLLWLSELDRHGCLGVGFGGGEPTLYRGFTQLCRAVSEQTGLAVTFTTHGHRLDDATCAELSGVVNFIRVSMDGIGTTYERLRGRRFADLRAALGRVRSVSPFGVNYVVNADTVGMLDAAVDVASEAGAEEFLLLPEQPTDGRAGISGQVASSMRDWVSRYKGPIRLTVSTAGADGLPACAPVPAERPLDAYAHIDARGVLKGSSFDSDGVAIDDDGVLAALRRLRQRSEGQG